MASQYGAQSGAKAGKDLRSSTTSKTSSVFSGVKLLDLLLYLSIPSLILLHLIVAPYTKVEESFNIQAAHDILVYGTPTSNVYQKLSSTYDHFTFPGAVPRTFVGAILLAGIAQPIVALVGFQHAQFVVRVILGLYNAACRAARCLEIQKHSGVHADVLACMTGVTLFGADCVDYRGGGDGEVRGWDGRRDGQDEGDRPHAVQIALDKTEDEAVLENPDFWRQFTYLLMEDPAKVVGGEWETVGVVKGYGGVEFVTPGSADVDGRAKGAAPVVGRGELVEKWKRRVRAVTGGWWIGPRMMDRIYILRRVMDGDRGAAVETK
ncbi:alpha-1,6- mannosyltransferase [Collariella sp. IMI 366227]|nr:alpha-1,6- mannosyltransferase [Collariella sp. IMI 366227]